MTMPISGTGTGPESLLKLVSDIAPMNQLIVAQQNLMDAVPHPLRDDALNNMLAVKDVTEKMLLYLASTGHKPWRPNPLPKEERAKRHYDLITAIGKALDTFKGNDEPSSIIHDDVNTRILTSTFGAIEESIEFYNTQLDLCKPQNIDEYQKNKAHQVEELTDELFYFLERMIMTDINWDMVINEYHRKWEVNMKRYADSKKGDTSWDLRHEGQL